MVKGRNVMEEVQLKYQEADFSKEDVKASFALQAALALNHSGSISRREFNEYLKKLTELIKVYKTGSAHSGLEVSSDDVIAMLEDIIGA